MIYSLGTSISSLIRKSGISASAICLEVLFFSPISKIYATFGTIIPYFGIIGFDHLVGMLSVKRGSPAGTICDKSIASA